MDNISKFKKVNAQYEAKPALDQDDIDPCESYMPNAMTTPASDGPPTSPQGGGSPASPNIVPAPTPRPVRARQAPKYLQDYVTK